MASKIKLGSVEEIPEGEGRTFVIGDLEVAVFRTRSGELFATQARCPHRQGPLADGIVGTMSVICPLHELTFDLTTGRSSDGTQCLTRYPVESLAGEIFIELPS